MNERGKMNTYKPIASLLIISIFLIFSPSLSRAQLILGQYEDEAPLRTWNTLGFSSAATAGMGDTRIAHAFDCSAALTNPALLAKLPLLNVTANTTYTAAQLFKYSLVNTGVLFTEDNNTLSTLDFDFGGISLNYRGWGLGISYSLSEHYDRPTTNYEYYERGRLTYALDFSQEGTLSNLNFSVSRQIGPRFAAGIGVNIVRGTFDKRWEERRITSNTVINDKKSHDFNGFYLNGGLYFDVSENLTLGAIFRSPFSKDAESDSLYRSQTPFTNTDIQIKASADSSFDQPLILGAGVSYKISENFRAAADLSYFNWADYKVDYFGEELDRSFKNIVKINLGAEYMHEVSLLGVDFGNPVWIGLNIDPQPMKEPNSRYTYFSFGSGLHFKHFFLDLSTDYGWERGSGDDLLAQRIIVTLSFRL